MIERTLQDGLEKLASWYPVVSITGPRQSGKSTLVRATFPEYQYVNLEDPAVRAQALADPSGFIANRPGRLIIDEAQYAPELFSAIQAAADAAGKSGLYILSGSQNFLMMRTIKQSLAGRVGIAKLLPLSFQEIANGANQPNIPIADLIFRGSYPQLHATNIPTSIFYENYIDTYVTRDVTGYLAVRSESEFRLFMKLCATRVGSLLNVASLASDTGVSVPTIKNWLSLLESSYVLRQLQPYHANIGKRLTKTPKLFFYDTGLLCALLGITSPQELVNHEMYGSVFENYVISERIKAHLNALKTPSLFFYRDDSKIEVDLLDTTASPAVLAEIKGGQTYRPAFARHVRTVNSSLALGAEQVVVYGGEGLFSDGDVTVAGIREWLEGRADT